MIVDASVAAKWFLKGEMYESEALVCKKDLEEGTVTIQAPSLIIYEVANTIWKRRDIALDLASLLASSATAYLHHIAVEPDQASASEAMKVARQLNITFYDSSYLALARITRQPFLSADSLLLEKAADVGIGSIHLKDYKL